MEDLVIAYPSKEITFNEENVQLALKSFESNLQSRRTVDLYFLINLYEFKEAWTYKAGYPSACETIIQYYNGAQYGLDNCYSFNAFMKKYFGLDRIYMFKCFKVYERFITKCCGAATFKYEGFSISKLFELLTLSNTQIQADIDCGLLKPTMTFKEIREYVKSTKNGSKDNSDSEETTFNEEDIPMAFDPNTHYEFSYFDNKSKNQLVNICCEYQKAYFKLKERKQKTK